MDAGRLAKIREAHPDGPVTHQPVVRAIHSEYYVVCETCGLMLDFRPLHALWMRTEDWDVQEYEAP